MESNTLFEVPLDVFEQAVEETAAKRRAELGRLGSELEQIKAKRAGDETMPIVVNEIDSAFQSWVNELRHGEWQVQEMKGRVKQADAVLEAIALHRATGNDTIKTTFYALSEFGLVGYSADDMPY